MAEGEGDSKPKGKASVDPGQVFGPALLRCRTQAGFTQEVLAHRAGLHPTTVSLYERGGRKPGYEVLIRLIGALGVDGSELLADTWIPPEIGKEGHFAQQDPPAL